MTSSDEGNVEDPENPNVNPNDNTGGDNTGGDNQGGGDSGSIVDGTDEG